MKSWFTLGFWGIVAAQIALLLAFIGIKEFDFRTGTEVVLQSAPVDPRSLLQGDYAILDYEIARLPPYVRDHPVGAPVYVLLKERNGVWEALEYRRDEPSDGELFIKGHVDRPGHLDLHLGTYFIPEGSGHLIQGAQDVKILASVDNDGSAAILDLLLDGEPFDAARTPDVAPPPVQKAPRPPRLPEEWECNPRSGKDRELSEVRDVQRCSSDRHG